MKITECPICKSTNVVKAPNDYGIVVVEPPANIKLTTAMPLNVYVCKDCGYVCLFHVEPSAIKIEPKD